MGNRRDEDKAVPAEPRGKPAPKNSADELPENEVQNQATVEDLGREGLGVAAKE